MQISNNKVVTIEYKMVDTNGVLLDTTDNNEPYSFIQGQAGIFPAIEEEIEGRGIGDRCTLRLEPQQAFGEHDDALLKVVPKDHFKFEGEIEVGMSFVTKKNGHPLPVTVTGVDSENITIDANHPLSGKPIHMDLVIVDVRDALEDELATGLVQTEDELFSREQESNESRVDGLIVKGPV